MKPLTTLFLVLAIINPGLVAADIYAFVDENGVRHLRHQSNAPNDPRYKLVMKTPKHQVIDKPDPDLKLDKKLIDKCLEYVKNHLSWKDRYSIRYEGHSDWEPGKALTLYLNAKNSYGAYGGEEPFTCILSNKNVIYAYSGRYYPSNAKQIDSPRPSGSPTVVITPRTSTTPATLNSNTGSSLPRIYLRPTGDRVIIGNNPDNTEPEQPTSSLLPSTNTFFSGNDK